MKSEIRFNWILIFVFSILFGSAQAQTNYELVASNSSLKVTGTSTLHDWHMYSNAYTCNVNALYDEKQDIQISSINFWCNANSIISENSMMDNKAHEALKTVKFPDINFKSFDADKLVVNGGTIKGSISGQLEIAGIIQMSELPFDGEIDTNGNIIIKGEVKVKMSSYKMKAPTALMGSIKTGDEITIHYDFFFKAKS